MSRIRLIVLYSLFIPCFLACGSKKKEKDPEDEESGVVDTPAGGNPEATSPEVTPPPPDVTSPSSSPAGSSAASGSSSSAASSSASGSSSPASSSSSTPVVTPAVTASTLTGRLIYHSYSSYGSWDGKLYLLNLGTKALSCLSCGWNVKHAINAHFSPDGTKITFMASDAAHSSGNEVWDVWLYTFGDPSPVNLTATRNLRNEDPKFSPSGDRIVFKERHWDNGVGGFVYQLKEMNLSGVITRTLTNGSVEASTPFYTADGSKVVYTAGGGSSASVRIVNADGTGDTSLYAQSLTQAYYPVVRDANTFFFARWASDSNFHDQVYMSNFSGVASSLPFNDPNYDYSDPFPVGTDYLAISSTRPSEKGGYDIYIADIATGALTSLDVYDSTANSAGEELGAVYSPH